MGLYLCEHEREWHLSQVLAYIRRALAVIVCCCIMWVDQQTITASARCI